MQEREREREREREGEREREREKKKREKKRGGCATGQPLKPGGVAQLLFLKKRKKKEIKTNKTKYRKTLGLENWLFICLALRTVDLSICHTHWFLMAFVQPSRSRILY